MGAQTIHVGRAEEYAPALRRAIDMRAPVVLDVDVSIDVAGYRTVWYPYPRDFYQSWKAGPLPNQG
jgi:acetolactate synthase-1/2/3 large subunit